MTPAEGSLVIERSLMPRSPVDELLLQFAAVMTRHRWLASGEPPLMRPVIGRREGSLGWWRVYEELQALELLHRVARTRELERAASAQLGTRQLINHPRRYLKIVPPGFWVPVHQDYPLVQGTPNYLVAWLALTNLCLRHVPGTPRLLPLEVAANGGVGVHPTAGAVVETLELAAGDVVFLDPLAVYGVEENRTDVLQLGVVVHFQAASEPIVQASLEPHHYPRVAHWRMLSRSWSTKRWIATPRRTRRCPFIFPRSIETWHEDIGEVPRRAASD